MTVWLVERHGTGEDSEVIAVFSNKENAEKFVGLHKQIKYGTLHILFFELDKCSFDISEL